MNNKRQLELDSLRGIAAGMVVFFHLCFNSEQAPIARIGITGVDLFFIISGFVILMTLDNTEKPIDFVKSRFIRLYPTYWFCVSLTFLINIINQVSTDTFSIDYVYQYLGNMTMFQYYLNIYNIDGPYWTMIIEMVFYISMLILFSLNLLRWIEVFGVLGLIAIFILDFYVQDEIPRFYRFAHTGYPILNFFPLFFSGIIFYKIKFQKATLLRYVLVLICFIQLQFLFDDVGRGANFISYTDNLILLSLYYAAFILYVNNWLYFINIKPFVFLGGISYSLYLFHENFSHKYLLPFLTKTLHFTFWPSIIIAATILILIASFITYYIEKPGMRYLRKRIF